jgi:hypothetical protein
MPKDLLTQMMGFVYSAAHYLGVGIVAVVQRILPSAKSLEMLVDPIGFLGILKRGAIAQPLFSAFGSESYQFKYFVILSRNDWSFSYPSASAHTWHRSMVEGEGPTFS